MIRLGLRLTLAGGKEAAFRLVAIAAAVMLGVAMLLITLAGINAVNNQNARYAWLETGAVAAGPAAGVPTPPAVAPAPAKGGKTPPSTSSDPLWWLLNGDYFDGQIIGRVDVAATGPNSPVPPGIPHLPGPGQYYASPAMTKLLRSTPAAQLGDRYPGTQLGEIGPSALPAPNSLVIVIGHTPAQLSHMPDAEQVSAISTVVPSSCNEHCTPIGINASGIDLVLAVTAASLLFPVLIFIGTASRLSAARREQRFAAMRLVGATPRQVSMISAVESTVAAVTGVAAGFGLFFLLRDPVASVPFTGAPFFPSDLSLRLVDILIVAIGVPVAAAVAARLALRRVQISPLGVSRRTTPRPPQAWRLIPLLVGLGELGWFVLIGRPATTGEQTLAYLTGILITMAGLIIAGPWLTMACSGLIAGRARRPAALIAGRRLADNPQAGFRAISGLVLALFVTSVAVGCITTIVANEGGPSGGSYSSGTLVERFDGSLFIDGPATSVSTLPPATLTALRSTPGVEGVAVIHTDPARSEDQFGFPVGVASCAELTTTPSLGRCPAGAQAAKVAPYFGGRLAKQHPQSSMIWPAVTISPASLNALPVQWIVVATNGSVSAVEQARTMLEGAYPDNYPHTIGEINAINSRELAQYQQLADVVILTSLVIAGCSLAVSVTAGLSERQRPFSLLRLTGVPLAMLRRVVVLESAVPLLLVALVSSATGFLAADLFLRSQLSYSLVAPGSQYYAIVTVGLLASLGVIASTLPLLKRISGPETARNE